MFLKRFIISSVAVFVFIFVFDIVFHGKLLIELYQDTESLWRSPDEMQEYFEWALLSQMLLAIMCVWIFSRHYENKGLGEGARFGLYVGVFMGVLQFGSYPYMPISFVLAMAWFFGAVIQGLGIGLTLSHIYRDEA